MAKIEEIESRWPGVKAFSLPSVGGEGKPHIELGVRGEPDSATQALSHLRERATALGGQLGAV